MLPYLGSAAAWPEARVEIGEVLGKRYVMQYPWKLAHQPPPHGTGQWQLYSLQEDLAESNDLAEAHPDIVEELSGLWAAYAAKNRVILPDWVSGY